MALIVFLRGVNVGGHRTFRPSLLAKELNQYDVVNIGAAGTFIVRKPGLRQNFRRALLAKLPFEAEVALCGGDDLVRLETHNPFGTASSRRDVVQFVSILTRTGRNRPSIPTALPPKGEWFVRVLMAQDRFILGEYRRHMKTIGYLGQLDKLFGGVAVTRNWNTILAMLRILRSTRSVAATAARQST